MCQFFDVGAAVGIEEVQSHNGLKNSDQRNYRRQAHAYHEEAMEIVLRTQQRVTHEHQRDVIEIKFQT